MKPDETLQGVSVHYGIATCHGCGVEESFSGEIVNGKNARAPVYKIGPGELDRFIAWQTEHNQHRAPAPEVM